MLLVEVSLEIHIGIGGSEFLLVCNEVDANTLASESCLELDICSIGDSLNVLCRSLLNFWHSENIIKV